MSARWYGSLVVSLVILAATSAIAQEKNEIGGMLGRTFVSDQGINGATFFDPVIHFGKGITIEGNYARRFLITPLFAVAGEVVGAYNVDQDLNGGAYGSAVVPTGYKALFITPAARLNLFPTTAVSPWVSFGAGFGYFNQASTLVYGGTNPGKNTTNAVIQGGLGLDVKLVGNFRIRGEVRDFWSGEPDFPLADTGKSRQHNYFVAGGVVWRF